MENQTTYAKSNKKNSWNSTKQMENCKERKNLIGEWEGMVLHSRAASNVTQNYNTSPPSSSSFHLSFAFSFQYQISMLKLKIQFNHSSKSNLFQSKLLIRIEKKEKKFLPAIFAVGSDRESQSS